MNLYKILRYLAIKFEILLLDCNTTLKKIKICETFLLRVIWVIQGNLTKTRKAVNIYHRTIRIRINLLCYLSTGENCRNSF